MSNEIIGRFNSLAKRIEGLPELDGAALPAEVRALSGRIGNLVEAKRVEALLEPPAA